VRTILFESIFGVLVVGMLSQIFITEANLTLLSTTFNKSYLSDKVEIPTRKSKITIGKGVVVGVACCRRVSVVILRGDVDFSCRLKKGEEAGEKRRGNEK
jgi:hypothetical protein